MINIWSIGLGVFALIVCGVALIINILGFINNYAKGDKYYMVNMVLIIATSLCIIFNVLTLFGSMIKGG
jgi:ABC-type siderophore export system fused ATPase/permease subunit